MPNPENSSPASAAAPLIDTHCHLHDPAFDGDRDEVIARARAAGVERIVLIGDDLPAGRQAIGLCEGDDLFRCVLGIHPQKAGQWESGTRRELEALLEHPAVVGVGETGYDFHYDYATRAEQDAAFQGHVALAQERGLPLVIHCREAYDETIAVLEQHYAPTAADAPALAGVMHCFFGTAEHAVRVRRIGFALGIGGGVTFRKSAQLQAVVAATGLEHLVLETDAPYVTPEPYRGKRNESSYLTHVAAKIGALQGRPADEVARATTMTARRLYPRLP